MGLPGPLSPVGAAHSRPYRCLLSSLLDETGVFFVTPTTREKLSRELEALLVRRFGLLRDEAPEYVEALVEVVGRVFNLPKPSGEATPGDVPVADDPCKGKRAERMAGEPRGGLADLSRAAIGLPAVSALKRRST